MKKTIVLLTIVLAIVAAPVFAEVTASGDIDLRMGYSGDVYSEKTDNDVDVKLGATLSDFTSLNFNLSATNDSDSVVTLDNATLTQDITGAMGVDSTVGVAMTFGISSFEPKEYQGVAGYGDLEYGDDSIFVDYTEDEDLTDAENLEALEDAIGTAMANLYAYHILDPGTIMTKASISLADTLTVDVAVYEPGPEVADDYMMFGINAYGTFGIVDASFSYLRYDADVSGIGINAAASPMDGLKLGAGMNMNLTDNGNAGKYGVSAAYTLDALTAGVAMVSVTGTDDYDSGADFVDVTSLAFNVNYAVNEAATVFAGVMMPDLAGEADLGYEVGVKYVLDGVSYSVGYTDDSDYIAYPADPDGNAFFRVQASF